MESNNNNNFNTHSQPPMVPSTNHPSTIASSFPLTSTPNHPHNNMNNNKYSNLPPDHILNKQHSKISIKQVQKPTQPSAHNSAVNVHSTIASTSSGGGGALVTNNEEESFHHKLTTTSNTTHSTTFSTSTSPTTLIAPTIMMNHTMVTPITTTTTTSSQVLDETNNYGLQTLSKNRVVADLTNIQPSSSSNMNMNNNINNNINNTTSNTITTTTTTNNNNNTLMNQSSSNIMLNDTNNHCITQIPSSASTNIPKNTLKFLVDAHSMKLLSECCNTVPNNQNSYFHIRIGNSKQLEMEITRHANRIKYFSNSCVYDNESQTKNWSDCFRIESEYIDDKPLLYIPITGSIQLNVEIPNMDIHLHDDHSVKYDLRWCIDCASHNAGCILLPIRYGYNCVLLLKMMRLEYVEFIAVKSVDLYYFKSLVSSNSSIQHVMSNNNNTAHTTSMNQVMNSANNVMNSVIHSLANIHHMQTASQSKQLLQQTHHSNTTSSTTATPSSSFTTEDKMDTSHDLDFSKLQTDESLSQ
ncbi:hypothetical protein C9374_013674 [Naegleria lovaniensis]|uniref:Uncharacterized protein n=1 Tax=Naegleria lovaniensis TaxID=51637 RepID=A0AA88KDU6_NAELO|nr:uncharacterized protein C9374_013674 [Naegleria lovaniensis]KAG2372666.1 hypothetical protein C9374_013674 [Naegleria lovaniensis]